MKTAAAVCLLAWSIRAQSIHIQGTVLDAQSGKPVAAAIVRLARAGLADTTGADGKFDIRGTGSGIHIPRGRIAPGVIGLALEESAFRIDVDRAQRSELAVYSVSGACVHRQLRILFPGRNFIPRPRLSDGAFVLALRTEAGTSILRFGNGNAFFRGTGSEAAATALAKGSAAFDDTLIVAAPGYAPVRTPLASPIDSGLSVKAAPSGGSDCGQSPSDPQAGSKAKNLLCYLRTHAYVSGQTDIGDANKIKSMTGRYPAIVAFDFMSYTSGRIETQSTIDWAKSNKGIVAFQWHWDCPHGGNYSANCDFAGDLDNPGSKLYKDIDLVVGELKKMGNAGVPVIFRPLHEANNNYMWWAKKGADAYKKLYKLIVARARQAGAHEILWVFNGMASGGGANTPMKNWYPGDEYVDIISGDYTQSQGDYTAMQGMGANKTIAISETMNQINPANAPPFAFSVVWASRDWNGNSSNDWKTAMANPKTISIDQLPDMTKW